MLKKTGYFGNDKTSMDLIFLYECDGESGPTSVNMLISVIVLVQKERAGVGEVLYMAESEVMVNVPKFEVPDMIMVLFCCQLSVVMS